MRSARTRLRALKTGKTALICVLALSLALCGLVASPEKTHAKPGGTIAIGDEVHIDSDHVVNDISGKVAFDPDGDPVFCGEVRGYDGNKVGRARVCDMVGFTMNYQDTAGQGFEDSFTFTQDDVTNCALALEWVYARWSGDAAYDAFQRWLWKYTLVSDRGTTRRVMDGSDVYVGSILGGIWDSAAADEVKGYIESQKAEGKRIGRGFAYQKIDGTQNVCKFWVESMVGSVDLVKGSSNPEVSQGNSCYSLEGAVYGVFNDAACTDLVCEFSTDANGFGQANDIAVGARYVKETKPPKGHASDPTVYDVTVPAGGVAHVNRGQVIDTPVVDGAGIAVVKRDAETGVGAPLGKATLALAEYEFSYYDGSYADAEAARASGEPERTWVLRTDGDGKADVVQGESTFEHEGEQYAYKVSGDSFYHQEGKVVVPLGTLTIRETKAPEGYLASDAVYVCRIVQSGDGFRVEGDVAFDANSGKTEVLASEQVKRGDLKFVKAHGATQGRLANVPFRLTSATTGESHVVTTDANGTMDTSAAWIAHSSSTNGNDGLDDARASTDGEQQASASTGAGQAAGVEEQATDASGNQTASSSEAIAGGDAEGAQAQADDDDATEAEADDDSAREASSETGEEGTARNDPGVATQESPLPTGIWFGLDAQGNAAPVDDGLGALPYDTYYLEELPCAENEGLQLVSTSVAVHRDSTTVDLGTVEDPEPTMSTTARDAADGDGHLEPKDESAVVDRIDYAGLIPGKPYTMHGRLIDKESGQEVAAGSVEFTPERNAGCVEVTFELSTAELAGRNLVVFESLESEGRVVATHEEPDNDQQTLDVPEPKIGTVATDATDDDHEIVAGAKASVVDEVSYEGLAPGQEYTLVGTLMLKATGTPLGGEGSPVTAQASFTPEQAAGTQTMGFEFDARGLSAGDELVVFEKLYLSDKELASHEDIDDAGQTVRVAPPAVDTTASDPADGDKDVTLAARTTLADHVAIEKAIEGKDYIVYGFAVDKETGLPFLQGAAAAEIPAEEQQAFAEKLREALAMDSEELPAAIDQETLAAAFTEHPEATKALASAELPFTPDGESAHVDLSYEIDGSHLLEIEQSATVVLCNVVMQGDSVVAVHADLEDADQTLTLAYRTPAEEASAGPQALAKTGDGLARGALAAAAALVAGAGGVWAARRGDRHPAAKPPATPR